MGRSSTSVPNLFALFFLLSTDAIWMGAHWGKDNILWQSCLQGL